MQEFNAEKLRHDEVAQRLLAEALKAGKEVILSFTDDKQQAKFMNEVGRLTAPFGAGIGGFVGGAIGSALGGKSGATVGMYIGTVIGGLVSYSLGAWLARFIYRIAGKDGKIEMEELLNGLGLRKGKVKVGVAYA